MHVFSCSNCSNSFFTFLTQAEICIIQTNWIITKQFDAKFQSHCFRTWAPFQYRDRLSRHKVGVTYSYIGRGICFDIMQWHVCNNDILILSIIKPLITMCFVLATVLLISGAIHYTYFPSQEAIEIWWPGKHSRQNIILVNTTGHGYARSANWTLHTQRVVQWKSNRIC